uniref:Sugar transporter SWEET1 n=1 Tax=Steinernema glaseri TaxID=37863 RepID=A0A1I8AUH8_9BILA
MCAILMVEVAKLPYVNQVEFLLNMIAPAFTMYFVYLLRRPFINVNLRILLANSSIGLMLLIITRMFSFLSAPRDSTKCTKYLCLCISNIAAGVDRNKLERRNGSSPIAIGRFYGYRGTA